MANPEVLLAPYHYYDHYRVEDPVHWGTPPCTEASDLGWWYIFRYADAVKVLDDHVHFGSDHLRISNPDCASNNSGPFWSMYGRWMKTQDPPQHTCLRKQVSGFFTTSAVEQVSPRIEWHANQLIDNVCDKGEFDVIADFAYPLALNTIIEMLGIAESDLEYITEKMRILSNAFDFDGWDTTEKANQVVLELREYLRDIFPALRLSPNDSILSRLLDVHSEDGPADDDELIAMIILLLFSGHKSVAITIGNGIFSLLSSRSEFEKLYDSPSLIRSAVREILRYHSPIQGVSRIVLKDTVLGDKTLSRGESVTVLLGAVNRDPQMIHEPNRFDITRDHHHLAMGWGIHYCVGANLGLRQVEIAINTLVRRLPGMQLKNSSSEWRFSSMRGLKTLPVLF